MIDPEILNKYLLLFGSIWSGYIIAMWEVEKAVKLTAFWTRETAKYSLIASFYVNEEIKHIRRNHARMV